MNTEERICGILGMAERAHALISGISLIEETVKARKGKFLLVATDAADETKKSLETLAERHGIPIVFYLTKEQLGSSLGKEYRAAALFLQDGFGKKIRICLKESESL